MRQQTSLTTVPVGIDQQVSWKQGRREDVHLELNFLPKDLAYCSAVDIQKSNLEMARALKALESSEIVSRRSTRNIFEKPQVIQGQGGGDRHSDDEDWDFERKVRPPKPIQQRASNWWQTVASYFPVVCGAAVRSPKRLEFGQR